MQHEPTVLLRLPRKTYTLITRLAEEGFSCCKRARGANIFTPDQIEELRLSIETFKGASSCSAVRFGHLPCNGFNSISGWMHYKMASLCVGETFDVDASIWEASDYPIRDPKDFLNRLSGLVKKAGDQVLDGQCKFGTERIQGEDFRRVVRRIA